MKLTNKYNNDFLKNVLDNISDAILFESFDHTILYVNKHFCNLFKVPVSPNELIGIDCSNVAQSAKKLFKENNIYSHSELEARYEIELEKYIKKVQIEARIMGDLATNHIIPSALKYQNELLKNVSLLREAALPEKLYKGQLALLKDVSTHIQQVYDNVDAMVEERKVANNIANSRDKAIAYEAKVKAQYFDKIRYHVDKLEQLVDDELWTLPKYRELLFLR